MQPQLGEAITIQPDPPTSALYLPLCNPQLYLPESQIRNCREAESKLEPDVTSERWFADEDSNWTDEPYLAHTQNSPHDAKEERAYSCYSRRQQPSVRIDCWIIVAHAAFEDKMICHCNSHVYG